MLKPDARIFNKFCETFSLTPSECVFVDDTEVNVLGAANVGFTAIRFTGEPKELQHRFSELEII